METVVSDKSNGSEFIESDDERRQNAKNRRITRVQRHPGSQQPPFGREKHSASWPKWTFAEAFEGRPHLHSDGEPLLINFAWSLIGRTEKVLQDR
jgi:hypothetical protein